MPDINQKNSIHHYKLNETYEEAYKFDPKHFASRRGDIFRELGEFETAINYYSESILLNPMLNSAFPLRAECYSKIGDTKSAIADFTHFFYYRLSEICFTNRLVWAT